ncbi:MAG: hypothetical protein U0R64_05475 [Candidatus Nanopelagicales bacterium]
MAALVVTLPNVLASAVDRNPGVDVSVVRITHGARVVAPGERVLLSATVMNWGDRATSAGEPLVVAARDLPAGVTPGARGPRPAGAGSCGPDACEYCTPVEPDKILSLPLWRGSTGPCSLGPPSRSTWSLTA